MERKEKILYHQIHPLKLIVDISTACASIYLMWDRQWIIALLVGFIPSVIITLFMSTLMDFEKQKRSAFGQYVARFMDRRVEACRILGYSIMLGGAWFRSSMVIIFGFLVIVLAWMIGLFHSRRSV